MTYEIHLAVAEFPEMPKDRFSALVEDIRVNGQREPIKILNGRIIDGRHRLLACQRLSIEPRYAILPSDLDPYAYVWSLNGERRDIGADQRYLIWKSCNEKSESWQAEQQRIRDEANRKRSEAQAGIPKAEIKERIPTSSGGTLPRDRKVERAAEAATTKATASHTNRGTVERMDRLVRERPDLAEQVKSGELKPTEANRQLLKTKALERVAALPTGKYLVIYADPPWQYNDSRKTGDHRETSAAEHHYPTMSFPELEELGVGNLAADDSVLLCWATFPLLPQCLKVVQAWGFKYKTAFVWDKGNGAFGHYHNAAAELLILATRGSCLPEIKEDQVQAYPRLGHSQKPPQWRDMIDRIYCFGPRIELFHRGNELSESWHTWGSESANG